MSQPTTTAREFEELAQFMDLMPTAAARFGEAGALQLLNPAARSLLREIGIEPAGTDLPLILDRLAPGLTETWRTSAGRAGVVVPARHCTVVSPKGCSMHLMLRMIRTHPRCTMIILDDVSAAVEQGRELELQRARAALVLEHIRGYGVAMLDQAGTVVDWNPSIGRLFGISADAIAGRSLLDRITMTMGDPPCSPSFRDVRTVIGKQGFCRADASWRKGDGQKMWGDCVIAPVVETGGSTDGYVAVIRDVSLDRVHTQELIDAALTDPLTGLHNRRGLEGRAEALYLRPGGSHLNQVWIMVDIDHFKRINDSYGHEAGDQVLRSVAEALRATARGVDIVARFGGEEFVVVLPETSAEMAARIAERLRVAIEAMSTDVDGRIIRITASFGVAQRQAQESQADVLERADAALYRSKNEGRNRVTISTSPGP